VGGLALGRVNIKHYQLHADLTQQPRLNEEIFASDTHKQYLVSNANGGYTRSEKGLTSRSR
jgi:hypothetical protein